MRDQIGRVGPWVVAVLAARLFAGCVEVRVTQWEAAWMLAEQHCEMVDECVRGWCEGPEACAAPVDVELLGQCTVRLEPSCWTLFQ